jgi:hypothetical protein
MANTPARPAAARPGEDHVLPQGDLRAQPPIRWPHPNRRSVAFVGLWLVGLCIALLVPASIVGPGEESAPVGDVWTAFSFTVLGAAVMLGAATLLYRRTGDAGAMVLGGVPAVATVAGGIILATTKLYT